MGYRAIKPLVVARTEEGSDVYTYQGSPVPDNVSEREIQRLLADGFIASDGVAEKALAHESEVVDVPEGEPSADWTTKQLTAHAEKAGVDVKAAKNKAEILAALGVK